MKKNWPKIRPKMLHGKNGWEVDCRIGQNGERKFFERKGEASSFAASQRTLRLNEGKKAFDQKDLAELKLTHTEAVKIAVQFRRAEVASVTVADGVASFIEFMRGNISPKLDEKARKAKLRYCQDAQNRFKTLLLAFGERLMVQLTTKDLDGFFGSLDVAESTRNTLRTYVGMLWKYGENNGWCKKEVAQRTKKLDVPDRSIEILTVGQAKNLLRASDLACLPTIVLGLFCGMRFSEIGAISWEKIDLEEKIVTIDSSVAKKRRPRRVCSIPDNAVAWLKSHVWTGDVMPANFHNDFAKVRIRAGFKSGNDNRNDSTHQKLLTEAKESGKALIDWPDNCLRPSAISYEAAVTKNLGRIAYERGTSEDVIRTNYLNLVKPSEGKEYYEILP